MLFSRHKNELLNSEKYFIFNKIWWLGILSLFENLNSTKTTTTTILVLCCVFFVPFLRMEQSSLQALTGVMRDMRYIPCCMRCVLRVAVSVSFDLNPQLVGSSYSIIKSQVTLSFYSTHFE